jgi:hypothetical protein
MAIYAFNMTRIYNCRLFGVVHQRFVLQPMRRYLLKTRHDVGFRYFTTVAITANFFLSSMN